MVSETAPGAIPGATFAVEFETDAVCPRGFTGDPVVLLYFVSWAYSLRFGAMHELAQATMHLQRHHKVDLRPLLTFADLNIEDEDDQFALDHSWQDAAALAACCRAATTALESDDEGLRAFTGNYLPALPERLRDLVEMCDWAAAQSVRVRLVFRLDVAAE